MRILAVAARWLFILCLPLLMLTASLGWAVNSFWLYKQGLEKYGINQATGLAQQELDKAAAGLIRYFNSDEDAINLTMVKDGRPFRLFNEREVVHLRDVKGLIRLDYRILLVTLIYVAGYAGVSIWRRRWRPLARTTAIGSGLTLGVMLTLGLGMQLDFGGLFWQFHLVSFSNDFWLLDPSRDYLVMMFPEGFWYDAARYIALATAGLAILLGGASTAYLKFGRKSTE